MVGHHLPQVHPLSTRRHHMDQSSQFFHLHIKDWRWERWEQGYLNPDPRHCPGHYEPYFQATTILIPRPSLASGRRACGCKGNIKLYNVFSGHYSINILPPSFLSSVIRSRKNKGLSYTTVTSTTHLIVITVFILCSPKLHTMYYYTFFSWSPK